MNVLEQDEKNHQDKYDTRFKKLKKNRKSLLAITGNIDKLINSELKHDDKVLKTYSIEDVEEDVSKKKLDVSFAIFFLKF